MLLSLTVCCSLDLTINVNGSDGTSSLPQKGSKSTINVVPKDIDYSKKSHHRDMDWEISVAD
ncbi:hypothetical protein [Flavobacterium limi]|uniref:Uncharacterized protein n=1 Tax=Flavobacterium limi TaxID=2045105 RepID=A0ABQ1TWE9_9FLAO|nr:hypothetical protein [Flavobacterium limi]GGF03647.1 hypothetical protein GCM10011518_10970 [Flavobacterium limi]